MEACLNAFNTKKNKGTRNVSECFETLYEQILRSEKLDLFSYFFRQGRW